MDERKATPGPWRIGSLVSYDAYTGAPFRNVWADDPDHPGDSDAALCVARCVDVGPVDENAALIAASPCLLEACEAFLEAGAAEPADVAQMDAAIGKARAAVAQTRKTGSGLKS